MAVRTERDLSYGVGQVSTGWIAAAVISLVLMTLGIYAYSVQAVQGEIVTGLRNIGTMGGATWGLYVAFLVYFMGVSFAGTTIAVLIRLLNIEPLKPVIRMAQLMTIIALILGSLSIMADVGKPLRALLYLPMYGRPMSPFFGTFTLAISGYFFASLVYLYLDGRRDASLCAQKTGGAHQTFFRCWAAGFKNTPAERKRHEQSTFWLALALLPLLIMATSTLGAVFGLQVGRPGWNSALQGPGFVILAGVSGIGLLVMLAALCRMFIGEKGKIGTPVFKWLGNILMVLTLLYLYFTAVEWLTVTYAASSHEAKISTAVLSGEYAGIFWVALAALVIPAVLLFIQFAKGKYSVSVTVISGLLVNVAAIAKRYLIVVPSQTHGTLLPYETGSYTPTWVEFSVIIGLMGLGVLLYILFVKVFPIMDVSESAEGGM